MDSKRLKALAKEISSNDVVLDVGTDHGYLSIYLKENNLCKDVYASDISQKALNNAVNNFKKHKLDIKAFVSDGFENIPEFFDTAIIAGVGTHTILKIIEHTKTPPKLVLGSNNEYYLLRKSLNKKGYKIVDEKAILENNHYYIILLCLKGKQHLTKRELRFGISNNEQYYKYLIMKNNDLIKKVPFFKKLHLKLENHELKGLIERK